MLETAAKREQRLGFLFESVLPVPIEEVHAVYAPAGRDAFVACAADRQLLRECLETGALVLGPSCAAGWLPHQLDCDRLNLLVNEFAPAPLRAARRRLSLTAAAAVLLVGTLICFGQHRRAMELQRRIAAVDAAVRSVYADVLEPDAGAAPAPARLTAELRMLEQTRRQPDQSIRTFDAVAVLAELLAGWPDDLYVMTDSLSVSSSAISFTVRVPDEATAAGFEDHLKPPEGWELAQPNVQREHSGLTVRVRMTRGSPG